MTFPLLGPETEFVYEAQRNLLTKTKTKAHNFCWQRLAGFGLGRFWRDLWSVCVNLSNQANAVLSLSFSFSLSSSLALYEYSVAFIKNVRVVPFDSNLCCAPPASQLVAACNSHATLKFCTFPLLPLPLPLFVCFFLEFSYAA